MGIRVWLTFPSSKNEHDLLFRRSCTGFKHSLSVVSHMALLVISSVLVLEQVRRELYLDSLKILEGSEFSNEILTVV